MKRLGLFSALIALAACRDGTRAVSPTVIARGPASGANIATALETVYGPERFTRTTGAPDVYRRVISTEGFEAPFVLRLRNGAAGGSDRVSSARLTIDGEEILGASNFSPQIAGHEIPITIGSTAELRLELASAPGTYVEVSIDGVRSALRVCPGVADAYQTLAEAVRAADAGETIRLCDGRHVVQNLDIGTKSLTIEAEHSLAAVVDADGSGSSINIRSDVPTDARIEIRGLKFVNSKHGDIGVWQNYGQVRISGSEFHPPEGQPYNSGQLSYAAGVTSHGSRGGGITIESNRFIGGDIGVHTSDAPGVRILNNLFVEQTNAAIHDGNGGGVHAEGNDIRGCGFNWCIGVFGGGTVQLLRNTIRIDISRPVVNAIQLHGGQYEISDNVIVGIGGERLTNNANTWPMRSNAIALDARVTVSGNRISGAFNGIGGNGTSGTATDNIVSEVGSPLNFFRSSMAVHRNDFSTFSSAFQFVAESPSASATCNWWGSAHGPDVPPHIPAAFYTPWSSAPIAGTTTTCDPDGGLPAHVHVCPTADNSPHLTVPTVAKALAVVAGGGMVTICDGAHLVQNVDVTKSVTVAAAGPGMPTLDANGAFSVFRSFHHPVDVVIRGLRFQGAVEHTVHFSGARSLRVEGSEFHPYQTYPYQLSTSGYREGYMSGIGAFGDVGSIMVDGSTFIGGDIGVHVNVACCTLHGGPGAGTVTVRNSRFSGQSNAGVAAGGWSSTSSLRVQGNTFQQCSRFGCAKTFSATGGRVEYVANRFQVEASRPVFTPLNVGLHPGGGDAVIDENEIVGVGGSGDRTLERSYPIDGFAIQVAAANVVVNRNRVTNAWAAFNFTPASGGGSDNVVNHVFAFLFGGGLPNGASATFTRNDITDYVVGVFNTGIFATLDLTCNWWGSAAGPANVGGGIQPSSYTPWAAQPIAGQTAVSCQ